MRSQLRFAVLVCLSVLLIGCNGNDFRNRSESYLIEGTLTGLNAGTQLTVSDNGGDSITLTTNGPFSFDLPIAYNDSYQVAVVTQPVGQICTVANYSGSGITGNVLNVNIVCSTQTYPITGILSGLNSGTSVVLDDNGGDALTLTANGTFTFPTQISYQGSYNVTVGIQPTGETCTVTNGAGTSVIAPVTNITVLCATSTFTIGGQLIGLASGDQVTLLNNGADALTLTANGTYTFATPVAYNGTYNVTVGTQPSGQICTVGNGSGIATAMNITNISVVCSTSQYTIGGNLTGLGSGVQLVLNDNGGDALTLTANGTFTFARPVAFGGSFDVTVATQPVGQTCTVSSGVGGPVTANVTYVGVLCAVDTYTIGGSISGLTAGGLVLKDNGGDALSVPSGSTSFQFATPVAYNSGYSVTVFQQPLGQTCLVGNASGTAVTANVSNVSITCTVNMYTVGGTVSGLSGSVVLEDNGGNDITLSGNGTYTFPGTLNYNSTYNVTITSQPTAQTCTVSNASGTATSTVTNVNISCVGNTYTVGGTLTGLSGTVKLLDNGVNTLTLTANGPFTFTTPIAQGNNYAVSVGTQPATQTCLITNGSGTNITANVTNVGVSCTTNTPTLTAISPAYGPLTGGVIVTLTGTNFIAGATTVTIDGIVIPATQVTVNSTTSLTFATPAHIAGTVAVTATTAGGTTTAVTGGFTYIAVPTLTAISPTSGPIAGGTTVTLTGTNFVPGYTQIAIGGNNVPSTSVTVTSSTSLTFTTPAHAAATAVVNITTPGGTSANLAGGYTYVAVPTVTSLTPTSGTTLGGTVVTITGTGFVVGNSTVTINGAVVTPTTITATTIKFTTPANTSAGNVTVSVTTAGGTSGAVPGGFTYVAIPTATSLTPTSGPAAGGTSVTITGTNFVSGSTGVTIGGNVVPAASVTVNSTTSLTFTTPAHSSGNVAVTVTTSAGTTAAISGGFTYVAAPILTSITPTSGSTAGGTSVTLTGTNLTGTTSVTFGGVAANSVTVVNATTVTCTTPAHTSGAVDVVVTTSGGSATLTNGFTYVAPTYTVTPSGDGHETISPSTAQTVNSGSTQAFTITPNSGYTTSTTVGGTCPAGSFSGSTYTTGAITANCIVTFSAALTTYTIGGTVTGLNTQYGNSVSMHDLDNGGTFSATANGTFTLSGRVNSGASYSVQAIANPYQTCSITGGTGSGTVGTSNVTSITVLCSAEPTKTLGGTISGLDPGTVLLLSEPISGQTQLISANGSFTFANAIPEGAGYDVTVIQYDDPGYPSASCSVQNPSGVVMYSNITNVNIACSH